MSYRVAVRFSLGGDWRFLGHQDGMRLFERALLRARLPLRWGGGFNPRPRLALPLPRPVGVASDDELLVVELEEPPDSPALPCSQLLERLAARLPAGVRLLDARPISAMPQPRAVEYVVDLGEASGEAAATVDLDRRIGELLASDRLVVQRRFERGRTRPTDIRPYLSRIGWDAPSGVLSMTLAVTPSGSARPAEVLAALGLPARELAHRIVRRRVDWNLEELGRKEF